MLPVGGTGSSKSTSGGARSITAATATAEVGTSSPMISWWSNAHRHKKSIINQREAEQGHAQLPRCVEEHCTGAGRSIGDIRDRETMEHALAFVITGHLAISALQRQQRQSGAGIASTLPEERRPQLPNDFRPPSCAGFMRLASPSMAEAAPPCGGDARQC